jgi:hypothetical protein
MSKIQDWATEKLEARDEQITLEIRAMGAWSNRALSSKKRLSVVEMLREQQREIMAELMKRAGY